MKYVVNVKISYTKDVEVEATSKENAITLAKAKVLNNSYLFSPSDEDVLALGATNTILMDNNEVEDTENEEDEESNSSFDDENL